MAEITEVYGQHYKDDVSQSRVDFLLNQMANNLSHRQFRFKLTETRELWNQNGNMYPSLLVDLAQKIVKLNRQMQIRHINKHNNQIRLLPYLITETSVEYLMVIDLEMRRAYLIYITPYEVNSY